MNNMEDAKTNGAADCRVLDASYIGECALVMAKAFSDSPGYNYILKDMGEKARVKALEWLFTINMELVLGKYPSALRGLLDGDGDDGKVVCCFFLVPNPYHHHSTIEMLLAGVWQVPFRFGYGAFRRLFGMVDDMKEAADKAYGEEKEDYAMLERMVVLPEYQGRGLGSRALRAVLGESSQELRLSTQEERNVRFYQRLGFEVVDDRDFYEEDPEFKFRSWNMVRKATRPEGK